MPSSYLNGNLGYFVQLSYLDDSLIFPDPQSALSEPNGLLAVGGDLSADRLLSAYRQGIFPWFGDNQPILWWSPNPRAVLDPLQFHLSRSLKKFIKKCDYRVTLNYDFASVIQACAVNHDETWITSEMINAYIKLHQLGYAHSIEVWQDNNLIGSLYGVAQGALFCGELMFSLQTNASKIALYAFCLHFVNCGGLLLDCQVLNEHTESLGVFEISRADYLSYLSQLSMYLIADDCYHKQVLTYY